jgi:hypothetical protein
MQCCTATKDNLWGPSSPRNVDDVDNLDGLHSGRTMNGGFLKSWSISNRRVPSCAMECFVKDPFCNTRNKAQQGSNEHKSRRGCLREVLGSSGVTLDLSQDLREAGMRRGGE